MSKSDFAKAVINQLKTSIGTDSNNYSANSASMAMSAVATAITNYLIANTKVTVNYAGVVPGTPPVPDPVAIDTFMIVGSCLPPGPSNSFDTWIKQLESNIIAGFKLAPTGERGVMFVATPFLTPGIIITQSTLKTALQDSTQDPQQQIWEIICDSIMVWINGLAMNTTPGVGTRPASSSSGTAVIAKVSIT